MLRVLLLLSALLMPVVGFLSQRGAFGPDNKTISDAYPTLLIAEGYAFSIWGVIFLLDIALAAMQWKRGTALPPRVQGALVIAFGAASAWMILFPQLQFWLALATIWASLLALLYAAFHMADESAGSGSLATPLAHWAVGLHAGWISLAVLLNTAQVIAAYRLASIDHQLPWSLGLWAAAAAILAFAIHRVRGHWAYTVAAIWGLTGVAVKQWSNPMPGARESAAIAIALAAVAIGQTLWERSRQPTPHQTST
ncbi:hypothetical protein AACH06_10790 [Ideonella sp. DXS29W]|uniref:Tryptophan-rich sensory protein n=1 Tax=Ideonella lacteola TaxID=2984193 RepID=A0ABU9BQC7_9BURK